MPGFPPTGDPLGERVVERQGGRRLVAADRAVCVVTCRLDDRVGEVGKRIAASEYGFGLVTTAGAIVLGRLRGSALDCDPDLRAEEVMETGPSTVRPDTPADSLAKRLAKRELQFAIVTDPEAGSSG